MRRLAILEAAEWLLEKAFWLEAEGSGRSGYRGNKEAASLRHAAKLLTDRLDEEIENDTSGWRIACTYTLSTGPR